MQLLEALEDPTDDIQRVRSRDVSRELDGLPWRRAARRELRRVGHESGLDGEMPIALRGAARADDSIEHGFDAAEALEEFDGSLFANARRSGNVVYSVALDGKQVCDLRGGNAHEFEGLCRVEDHVVLHRIEHDDAIVDELEHVLVA